ncbi:MAG: RagB/SusD family nutrient uptake outer membrane protein [Muribaculaceae bacterium]|nr:RagB/SusD family nutrient uptake outer membrane protein [Muribaculaceae bacterium]
MKNIFKIALLGGVAFSMALTGCIEEVEPTNGVTQDQLDDLTKAGSATLYAIPAKMVAYSDAFDWHGYIGYPGMMQIRDRSLDEMICASTGTNYNQWSYYERNRLSQNYWFPQVIWNYYNQLVLATNKATQRFPKGIETEDGKGARAKALAYRAMLYLDMARWFEFLPNDKTSNITTAGNDILHLCVYGLFARLYLWIEDYAKAAEYADKAIAAKASAKPLTEAEWVDPKTGFNRMDTYSSWMWGIGLTSENDAVRTGICNFTSFVSVETTYGYAGPSAGAYPAVGRSFYDRISNTDFRKLSWIPATRSSLVLKITLNGDNSDTRKRSIYTKFPLAPLKFRPGNGNCTDPTEGSATDLPLMRIEEMYFIKYEAMAHTNPTGALAEFTKWMKEYRDPKYSCDKTSVDDVVEEIVFQKRVEFWGEGLNFFDVKRLGYKVTRAYDKTNFYPDSRFNTEGRPAWFNMPIVKTEADNNHAVDGWNNPDVDGLYIAITE